MHLRYEKIVCYQGGAITVTGLVWLESITIDQCSDCVRSRARVFFTCNLVLECDRTEAQPLPRSNQRVSEIFNFP